MILVDISSVLHKSVHGLVSKMLKETKEDYVDILQYRKEFHLTVLNIVCDHISKFKEYSDEVVICLDDKSGLGNWRRRVFPMYKHSRRTFRDSFKTFSYSDAHKLFNEAIDALEKTSSAGLFKTIGVPMCEADDIILVLGRHFAESGRDVLILSPDKDFLQLHDNHRIKQYSWTTGKMVEMPDSDREDWLLEHICIGDSADNVPRIVDFQGFLPGVEEYLRETGILTEGEDAWDFSNKFFDYDDFESFGGVFTKEKFGFATLKKRIKEFGSLEKFLDSNITYKKNYFRNRQLVLEEGIPSGIKSQILRDFESLKNAESPAKSLVQGLGLDGYPLPDIISNKYITETQLSDFLDW